VPQSANPGSAWAPFRHRLFAAVALAIGGLAWQDATDPDRIVEQFVVASWDEHLRQHERVTLRDAERLAKIRAMTDPGHPVIVTHWLTPGQEGAPPA
jgi:hypothetical protein